MINVLLHAVAFIANVAIFARRTHQQPRVTMELAIFTAAAAIALLSKILEFRTCALGGW
jgi:hypothetical protein